MTAEPVVMISAIEHFAYCPRQCALVHGDGVWTDNAHTVRGTRAHRRVDSGEHRTERGKRVLRGIPLWSESLGLSGRADVVEVRGKEIHPVEYKSGTRHGLAADLQLCAQALCLEEMLNLDVPVGSVWYGGPRRRVEVRFTASLRRQVTSVVVAIRNQLLTGELPVAVNDARCRECQLLHHCLPGVTGVSRRIERYMSDEVFGCDT